MYNFTSIANIWITIIQYAFLAFSRILGKPFYFYMYIPRKIECSMYIWAIKHGELSYNSATKLLYFVSDLTQSFPLCFQIIVFIKHFISVPLMRNPRTNPNLKKNVKVVTHTCNLYSLAICFRRIVPLSREEPSRGWQL